MYTYLISSSNFLTQKEKLAYTIPMPTNIIALGTGAADSTKYYQTSFLIQDAKTNLLMDTGGGSGILAQMDRFKIGLNDIQSIFITHKHIDHIFGIFWILRMRGAAISAHRAPNLTIYASRENITLIRQVSAQFLKQTVISLFDTSILFVAVDEQQDIKMNDWGTHFFDTQSAKEEQWGCNIVLPNDISLSFIGDEPYTDKILSYCLQTDYLFHDAYCLERDRELFHPEEMSHSTVKEAAMNAESVGAKNLILFHTEDTATFGRRKELYTAEAKECFSGNVFVPDDGDVIESS